MAGLIRSGLVALRSAPQLARSVSTAPRAAGGVLWGGGPKAAIPGDSKDSNTGLGVSGRIPDVDEQATGLELRELNAIKAGDEDPFGMAGVKVGPFGTKENPRIVPSHFESRIVGCYTDDFPDLIHYFTLHEKDGPTEGPNYEWFKLERVADDAVTH